MIKWKAPTLFDSRHLLSVLTVTFNTDNVRGVDYQTSADNPAAPVSLIVRPFQWKGSVAFRRDCNRGAAHNELGMQAVEIEATTSMAMATACATSSPSAA